jgi:predicted amidohydrolase
MSRMKTGFLQFKPEFGKVEHNIKRISELIPEEDFDLLVLPELANSGYLFSSFNELKNLSEVEGQGKFFDSMLEISKKKNAFLVAGFCERVENDFYNSAYLIYPDGKFEVYRKIHLFDEEKKWFKPGDTPGVYEIEKETFGRVKIGVMICFDWIFPETARALALQGAQIICHPSNLVMPYCQRAMFTRALENHVFTITANRIGTDVNGDKDISFTGQSVILDPKGNYLAEAGKETEECRIVEINPCEALDKYINPNNHLFADRRVKID